MVFDFAAAKLQTRRLVHETFGVDGLYQDNSMSTPAPIRVRWHSKIDRFGDLESAGYAEVIEGIDRVILSAAQARELNVIATGIISLQVADIGTVRLSLSAREEAEGPFEECWMVAKL